MENNFNILFEKTFDSKNFNLKIFDKKLSKNVLLKQSEVDKSTTYINELVVLAFALNMALENYKSISGRNKTGKEGSKSYSEMSVMLKKYFSAKFLTKLDFFEKDSDKNLEAMAIEGFNKIESKLFNVLTRVRNYHSHFVHEPGILFFQDLFLNQTNISDEDFEEVKEWLIDKFESVKKHLIGSIEKGKSKLDPIDEEKNIEISRTLEYFKKLRFNTNSGKVTHEGFLFFACMFLTKKQSKMILEKWPEFRVINGYENSIKTFFSYYCLSENYSINNENVNLFRFREIAAKLSSIPIDSNPQMARIYKKIRELNLPKFEELNAGKTQIVEYKKKIKKEKEFFKEISSNRNLTKEQKALNKKEIQDKIDNYETEIKILHDQSEQAIVPTKKSYVITGTLVQFLIDNQFLKELNGVKWKVAVKKQPEDHIEYFENNRDYIDKEKSLTFLKSQIKAENDSEKKAILKKHLKELKRNFKFINISDLKDDSQLLINRKNAMFSLQVGNFKPITVILPPDLLKKWVFLQLFDDSKTESNKGQKIVEGYVKKYLFSILSEGRANRINSKLVLDDFSKEYKWIKNFDSIGKVKAFPRSIYKAASLFKEKELHLKESILHKIELKKTEILNLKLQNEMHPKPWKFASKKKIDIILDFIHHDFLNETYSNSLINSKTQENIDAYIRHSAFSIDDYDVAREFLRFFGRYKNNTIVEGTGEYEYSKVKSFLSTYQYYLSSIEQELIASGSLEELFLAVTSKWLKTLDDMKTRVENNKYNEKAFIKTFKIRIGESSKETENALATRSVSNLCIPDELFQLKEHFESEWQETITKNPKVSEFALMRMSLAKSNPYNTNADYIYQKILPHCSFEKGKLPITINQILLRIKNEELLMMEMARYYWKQANGADLNISNLTLGDNSDDYYQFTPYNKLYKTVVEFPLKIDLKSLVTKDKIEKYASFKLLNEFEYKLLAANIKNIKIRVPANRFDNKFISSETKLMGDYILWYEKDKLLSGQVVFDYDDLENGIMRQLGRSIYFIQLVLFAEQLLVKQKINDVKEAIKVKYNREYEAKDKIVDFYLDFKDKLIVKDLRIIVEEALEKQCLKEEIKKYNKGHRLSNEEKKYALKKAAQLKPLASDYLLLFRNYSLHYKLQDETLAQYVRKALEDFVKVSLNKKSN